MKARIFITRCLILIAGMFIIALGIAVSVRAGLGVSPISCAPYVYSLGFPVSMGTASIILNSILILVQVILRRKNFKPIQLLQIPLVLVFGFFTDFTLYLLSDLQFPNYLFSLAGCLISCAIIAFGVFLEVKAKLIYLPGEGLSLAIVDTFQLEFGKAKITVDTSLVTFGILSSLIILHNLQGVREGTVIAAFLVGYISRIYGKHLKFVDSLLSEPIIPPKSIYEGTLSSPENLVITISREYGSGGHDIGKLVADQLGIKFYDRELIEITAAESGFTEEYIRKHEQNLASNLLFSLYEQNYAYVNEQLPPLDVLFLVQNQVIREISRNESCVIVGRCANFVLKDHPRCFNVFIHATRNYRIKRLVDHYGIDPALAEKELDGVDKKRENYCRHYTGKIWNDASQYHLSIDSSSFGEEQSARMILEALEKFLNPGN